jgi:hypothetical protein
MNKPTLVTALYHHSPMEIVGGRGWDFPYFAAPLLNVLKLDLPIVIYTHDKMEEDLSRFLESHNIDNYHIINYDLSNFKYSEEVLQIKRDGGLFIDDKLKDDVHYISNDRNTHLCLNKLYWLNKESEVNRFNSDKFFWIDAGLFHHGIFPEKYGGRERMSKQENIPSLYYPENKSSIFTPQLGLNLGNIAERFLSLRQSEMPINEKMRKALDVDGKTLGYIVGGLFGGPKDFINNVLHHFDKGLSIVLENKILTLEEDLLSCISAWQPDLYQLISFNNWHHDIKGEPCYYGAGEDAECFYKIFKNLSRLV